MNQMKCGSEIFSGYSHPPQLQSNYIVVNFTGKLADITFLFMSVSYSEYTGL